MEDKLSLTVNYIKGNDVDLKIAGEVLKAYTDVTNTTVLENLTEILTNYDVEMLNYIPKEHLQRTYFFEVMKNFIGTNIKPNPICNYLLTIPDEYVQNLIKGRLKDKYEIIQRQLLYMATIVRVKIMTLSNAAREQIFKLINPGNIREVQPVIDEYEKDVKLEKLQKQKNNK